MKHHLLAMLLTLPLAAAAQSYPTKPLKWIVPFPPGGSTDGFSRPLAAKLSELLGQPVVVENVGGAGASIGSDRVAKSAPDGYTLLLGMDSLMTINPHLYAKMPYDTMKDLVPVASLVSNGFFLAVNPAVPAHTLAEFIEFARRTNPPLQYASGGNGSQHHLTMERLKVRAGINMIHIPYKGGSPAATATVAGEVSATMSGTSSAPQIKAGRLRALAFTGPQRSPVMPDVPTVAELYADFTMVQWYGLFAPAGTSEAVITRLRTEVNKALALPEVKDRLRNAGGVEAWITTPEEFAAEIRAEFGRYSRLVKEVGAKVD